MKPPNGPEAQALEAQAQNEADLHEAQAQALEAQLRSWRPKPEAQPSLFDLEAEAAAYEAAAAAQNEATRRYTRLSNLPARDLGLWAVDRDDEAEDLEAIAAVDLVAAQPVREG